MARRRGLAWVALAVVLAATGAGAVGVAAGGWATGGAAYALGALVAAGVLVADPDRGRVAAEPRAAVAPARPALAALAETVAGAAGRPAPVAGVVDHAAPNVGVLGDRLLVTRGAVERLSPEQLEAVCAAQVAVAADPAARRLALAAGTLRMLPWAALGGVCASTVLAPFRPLTTLAVMVVLAPAAAAGAACSGPVSWWAGVAADAVCVRTTRHPEALAAALGELAAWNGRQVPVRGRVRTLWSPVDAWWAVPVGPRWSSTLSVDGEPVRKRTSEQQHDVRLLLRAAAVRGLGAGEPATLAAYRRVAAHLDRAAADAAAGRSTDVDGTMVGLRGAALRRRRPTRR